MARKFVAIVSSHNMPKDSSHPGAEVRVVMFEKILVGTDISKDADFFPEAWLNNFRSMGVKKILLTYIICPDRAKEPEETLLASATPDLERRAQRLTDAGFEVTPEVALGVPGRTLLELADQHDVSLMVVGSHQVGSLRGALIGSTSYSVLHESIRPILLLRRNPAFSSLFQRILFPTDFSENSERAFLVVEALACATGCPVTLFHVHDQTRIDPYLRDRLEEFDRVDRQRLESLKDHLERNGAGPCQVQVYYGVPAKRILLLLQGGEHSLVIMGSQGRGYIPELYMGSTANAIARHAPLSVLFVPHQR